MAEAERQNFEVTAPNAGTIVTISGPLPYSFVFVPTDRELTVRLSVANEASGAYTKGSEGRVSSSLLPEWEQSVKISGIEHEKDQTYFVFSFRPPDMSFLGDLEQMTLKMRTVCYPVLVSPQAFVTETDLWVAQPTYRGSLTVYTAHRVTVERMPGDQEYIPCISGLTEDSLIITGWDRPLAEGRSIFVTEP